MKRTRPGFTLLELALAMGITAVTGLAVAGVSMALAGAHAHSQDHYAHLQTGRSALMRLQAALRRARLVTGASSTGVAYWGQDTNDDGRINLSEIVLLRFDADARALRARRVVFPAGMDPATREALDVRQTLQTLVDLPRVQRLLSASPYCTTTDLAAPAHDCRFRVWPEAPFSRLLVAVIRVGQGPRGVTLRSAVMLRADLTGRVGQTRDGYVLTDG